MPTLNDYKSPMFPTWCPGCGDFGIWQALKQALVNLGKDPHEVLIVYGVGCSGNMASFVRAYGFHGLHGRSMGNAFGAKVANPNLTVIVVAGDGDTYSEGINHFIASIRQNIDINLIVHDNRRFSLTTGQASPTADQGQESAVTPRGSIDKPLRPLELAISQDASFVAQGFAGDIPALTSLFEKMITNKGFSYTDVLQHCVTFDKEHTAQWYREHITPVEQDGLPKMEALELLSKRETLPVGVLYKKEQPTYTDAVPAVAEKPLHAHDLSGIDIQDDMKEMI